MNTKIGFLLMFFWAAVSVSIFSQEHHVRIGFIGNSITAGTGLPNPATDSYPAQLSQLLKNIYGDTCIVTNYAVSGRTMLKKGDFPWWNEPEFVKCRNYAPDICFISLGTNDSKPYNWDVYGEDFFKDYQALIDTFKVRNPATKFVVCLPPPAFGVVYDIRNPVIVNEIIPLIDSISKVNGTDVVDFYTPLVDSAQLFPDKIHPDKKGAAVFAKIVFDQIVSSDIVHRIETGKAFATGLTSTVTGMLKLTEKATISWTTINSTKVLLNGNEVTANGSLLITPLETTTFKLVAVGETNSDSITYTQKVYVPHLARISIQTAIRSINAGIPVNLKLNYYDQYNKPITDSVFEINWSVNPDIAHFANQVGNAVQFIGNSPGSAVVSCTIGNVTSTLTMTVKGYPTGVEASEGIKDLTVFPNPFNNKLSVTIPVETPGMLTLQFIDTEGRNCKTEAYPVRESGDKVVELNTSDLAVGIYLLKLDISGKSFSAKIIKGK